MDIGQLISTGMGRRVADGRSQASKRALLAVSRSLEAIAGQLARGGDGFSVVALFEDATYFEYEWSRYAELARHGQVIVGFSGVVEPVGLPVGVGFLPIPEGDPLEDEWTVLVLSEAVSAGMVATDLGAMIAARSLERGRLFTPEVAADPGWVLAQAERILTAAPAAVRESVLAPGRAANDRAPVRGEQVLRDELEDGWWRTLTLAANLERIERAGMTDPLTGAYNRRFLEGYLSRLGPRAPEISAALFDLDGFKPLNDRYGHSAGDTALRTFADVVRANVRETDVLVRHGGDEWLLLLPGLPLVAAEARVDGILAQWEASQLPTPAEEARLAASVGVGSFRAAALDIDALDAAMYAAKATGGGRRVSLPPVPPEGD